MVQFSSFRAGILDWSRTSYVGERLFFKVIFCLFTFQCACNATAFFFASERMHRMPRFFHHWEDRIQSSSETGANLKHIKRWSIIFTVQAILFVTFHFLNQSFGVFGTIELVRNASAVFVAPFPDHPALHVLFIIINIFDFAAWIFPIFFFIHICMILCDRFGNFAKRLRLDILRGYKKGGVPSNVESLRYQHQELCLAVEHSNNGLFTYINAISYGTMLPLACFLLYQLLFSSSYKGNVSAILMYVVWLTSIFVNVPVVSWIAAIVNTRAHEPINMTYNIRVEHVKNDDLMVISMFLSRLNGHAIGYTVFDLVTLTKPFILTMGGLGVTYFALLAEFER
ncbi:uncharacterized protein [Ptychodera flava]|uniref:uncharacterized protein n=1 Tax=Ptychodera flava TaxID=63121 RepID=UPI003969D072